MHPDAPPSTKILRKAVVVERTGLSHTTIWRLVRAGTFPAPIWLSANAIGWREADVEAWLASRGTTPPDPSRFRPTRPAGRRSVAGGTPPTTAAPIANRSVPSIARDRAARHPAPTRKGPTNENG